MLSIALNRGGACQVWARGIAKKDIPMFIKYHPGIYKALRQSPGKGFKNLK
jgi:hypothetical protein